MDGDERCVLGILAFMVGQQICSRTTALRTAFLMPPSSVDSSIAVRLGEEAPLIMTSMKRA